MKGWKPILTGNKGKGEKSLPLVMRLENVAFFSFYYLTINGTKWERGFYRKMLDLVGELTICSTKGFLIIKPTIEDQEIKFLFIIRLYCPSSSGRFLSLFPRQFFKLVMLYLYLIRLLFKRRINFS